MRPVIALEINEIPWRVIDRFCSAGAFPNIRKFFEQSHQYTSRAVDSGELSPWVSWPTMHRGMCNEEHGVLNLGQDPTTFRGTPIWQDLRQRGYTIGICGPMQSWPPLVPGDGGFYVPDTFAHDASCHPKYIEPLQSLNLSQVRKNPRVVLRSIPSPKEIALLFSCVNKAGIRPTTLAKICRQLIWERFDSSAAMRRPVFQTMLFWDVFRKHYDPDNPPAYASFFTNHVAGVMHRYWKDIFPEDFANSPPTTRKSRESLMRFALTVLDEMIKDVFKWTEKNANIAVIFASSMGQGPIHRDYHEGIELHITNVDALLAAAGLTKEDYTPLLAMVPQVAADIGSDEKRVRTAEWLSRCVTAENTQLFKVQIVGTSISITVLLPTRAEISAGYALFQSQAFQFNNIGLAAREVEAGTGYHIPEGTMAVFLLEAASNADKRRAEFPASHYKDWLTCLVETGKHDPRILFG